eukprot:gene725-787_t
MFWGKKKSEDDKERQLKQLKNAFPSLRRPQNDDNLFEIRFLVDNQNNALRIFVPADFPHIRPVLQVAGPVTHPWLDQFKQVNGCTKLINWNKNCTLLEVVEETLSALMNAGVVSPNGAGVALPSPERSSLGGYPGVQPGGRPSLGGPSTSVDSNGYNTNYHPYVVPISGMNGSARSNQPSPLSVAVDSKPAASPSPGIQDPNHLSTKDSFKSAPRTPLALPSIPSSFPELEKMTDLQLERLLRDEVALMAHVNTNVESVKAMYSMIDELRQSNEEVASANVLMNDELQDLKKRISEQQSVLLKSVEDYKQTFELFQRQMTSKPEEILQEVRVKCNQLDQESEEIGRKLTAGEIDLPSFLQTYLDARTKYHILASKVNVVKLK